MSKGAGRLERAIVARFTNGVTTEELCRAAYPDVPKIEKKHRVAVLQVLHRFMTEPPRPTDDRYWMVIPRPKRGSWGGVLCPGCKVPDQRRGTAHHEAGHALVHLLFGEGIQEFWVRSASSSPERDPDHLGGVAGYFGPTEPCDEKPRGYERSLMVSAAGVIAEAHYLAKWPLRSRGVSHTYAGLLAAGGRGDANHINVILAKLSDDPHLQSTFRLQAQKRAQAIIRSKKGWRFVRLLAAKILKRKSDSLSHEPIADIFTKAYGRDPPWSSDWDAHWPPTLKQLRDGWLPPRTST
jgi:hypothetical protein